MQFCVLDVYCAYCSHCLATRRPSGKMLSNGQVVSLVNNDRPAIGTSLASSPLTCYCRPGHLQSHCVRSQNQGSDRSSWKGQLRRDKGETVQNRKQGVCLVWRKEDLSGELETTIGCTAMMQWDGCVLIRHAWSVSVCQHRRLDKSIVSRAQKECFVGTLLYVSDLSVYTGAVIKSQKENQNPTTN